MFCLCYVGFNSNSKFYTELMDRLSNSFRTFWVDRKHSFENGSGEDLLILNADKFKELTVNSCVLVFEENAKINVPEISCENIVAIVSDSSKKQITELRNLNVPVVVCGSSQKNTITYSSCAEGSMVVSLQRNIHTLNGEMIEPFEIPICFMEGSDIYAALAYTSVCAILGQFDKNCL